MAENKKSFLLYCDTIHTVNNLTDAEAGKLFKHVLAYVNDLNPETDDRLIKVAFEPIKQALKRDLQKYECIREKKREAGIKSAEARKQMSTPVESVEQTPTNSTVNDNVIVSVIDNVSESNTRAPEILKSSNLFRQPKIPLFDDVHRVFLNNGGTKEMAESFFNKHSATGWFANGSPITNFSTMVPGYIRNWKNNENGKTPKRTTADTAAPGKEYSSTL